MSVGYADTEPPPFNPDDLEVNQPNAAPIIPPEPTGIDSINTGDVANNIAAVGQPGAPANDNAGPSSIQNLDTAKIAQNIANVGKPANDNGAAPGAPTAAPATTSEAPKSPDATRDLEAAQSEEKKAQEASDKAKIDLAKAGQPALEEQQKIREQQVAAQQETIRRQQEIQKRYDSADYAAQQQLKQSQDAVKNFKFRDYFADDKGGTDWARKIGAALATALGAFGAGLTHGPNYALQILNKDMDDAHQHDLDHLQQLKDEEVQARTGIQDAQLARQKALADLTVSDAARDKLVAAQLEQAAARKASAEFAPGLQAQAAKLKADAAQKDAAAKKQLIDVNLKLQDEQRKKTLDEASIAEKNAQAGLANAKTTHMAHKGGGVGGGGGSATSVGENAEKLAKAIREGHDGKPLTDDEIIHLATQYHIPLAGKAGVVTLDKVRSVAKFDADAALKAKRAGIQDERLDNTEANAWAKENGLDAINKKQRELSSLQDELNNNKGNPLAQALAVEKAVSAARGGAASKQALGLALEHLGGTLDNAKSVIDKIKDGTLGEKKMQNFQGFLNGQLGAAQKEGKEKYDAFNKYIESQPADKRAALLNQRGRLFSGFAGFGANSPQGDNGSGKIRLVNKKTGEVKFVTPEEAKAMGAIK